MVRSLAVFGLEKYLDNIWFGKVQLIYYLEMVLLCLVWKNI